MSTTDDAIRGAVDEIFPGVVADRRHLHQHPELSFQEVETARFIAERLQSLGLDEIQTGIGKTGVTGVIRGTGSSGQPGQTVLLRADMDALPILEETDTEYRSQNDGVMHACGHDSHVSMLLGTSRLLMDNRSQFDGTVKVLFQPAEEGAGGARAMIADGVLDDLPDATFGIHIWQHADLGTVEVRSDVAMVGADLFTIDIQGKGGHGARPSTAVDPIVVGSTIVNALQTLVSRNNDPTIPEVVTIGAFESGTAFNVIPDTAHLRGTIRTVSDEQRTSVMKDLEQITTGTAAAMGAVATINFLNGTPPTINDPAMADLVRQAARTVVAPDKVVDGPLKVVSEDYSEFLNRIPGCYYFIGSRNPERDLVWGHHHAKFDIDEDAMAIGIETMTKTVLNYFGAKTQATS